MPPTIRERVERMVEAVTRTGVSRHMVHHFNNADQRFVENHIRNHIHCWKVADPVHVKVTYTVDNECNEFNPWDRNFYTRGDFTVSINVTLKHAGDRGLGGAD